MEWVWRGWEWVKKIGKKCKINMVFGGNMKEGRSVMQKTREWKGKQEKEMIEMGEGKLQCREEITL